MGQHAEDIINGDVDQFTGEWLGDGQGYPRSKKYASQNNDPKLYTKGTKSIRKELAILIKNTIAKNPDSNKNTLVEQCRRDINTKYGKGWREQF